MGGRRVKAGHRQTVESFRFAGLLCWASVAVFLGSCTHQIIPVISVSPPQIQAFDASVVLVLTEELEAFESEQKQGFHTYFFHFGQATADGMATVFQNVFTQVRIERGVGQAHAMALIARSGSLGTDYLAVPRVQAQGSLGLFDMDVNVEVVVDIIDLGTGQSTVITGTGLEGFSVSATGSAETALEDALAEIQAALIAYHPRSRVTR